MARVAVAMSGGVDSSVAAALLVEAGHEVVGLTMALWPGGERGACCTVEAAGDAAAVAARLGIAHHVLDFREIFRAAVIQPFIKAYGEGLTPSPCLECNRVVKFDHLLGVAESLGAEFLATGHYARREGEPPRLLRARDLRKDQSYFLYGIPPRHLGRVLFPLGEFTKEEVRKHAAELRLPTAQKAESQEICFVAGNYRDLLPDGPPATLLDKGGNRLGEGLPIGHYTVGQRRGIGLGGGPWYVLEIRAAAGEVVIGRAEELERRSLVFRRVNFFEFPAEGEWVLARIRSGALPERARFFAGGRLDRLVFERPVRGVAPGQAVVLYRDEVVLGGGVIEGSES